MIVGLESRPESNAPGREKIFGDAQLCRGNRCQRKSSSPSLPFPPSKHFHHFVRVDLAIASHRVGLRTIILREWVKPLCATLKWKLADATVEVCCVPNGTGTDEERIERRLVRVEGFRLGVSGWLGCMM